MDAKTPGSKTPGSGRRLLGLIVAGLILASLGFGAWRHWSEHRQVMDTAQRLRDFVPNVRVREVRASEPVMTVTLPGATSAIEAAGIYARASGYIEKRHVDIGSRVKTGQLLAEITAPELDRQIAQALATLAQTEAALGQARANLELTKVTTGRSSKLVPGGYISLQQADTDRLNNQAQQSAVRVAQANLEAQQAQVQVLRQQKAYQRVLAPFDGVVTQRNIDNGSLVQADAASGTSLFALARTDTIRIQLYVPQDQAFGLAPGVEALVRVPEIPGRAFPGKVARTADALAPNTRTLLVEIEVPNPDQALTPGVYCSVELRIPRRTPSLIVPSEAVIFNRNGLHVAVVEDGAANIRKINAVRELGTEVEVDDGVRAGDKVILNPPVNLGQGSKVGVASPQQ